MDMCTVYAYTRKKESYTHCIHGYIYPSTCNVFIIAPSQITYLSSNRK